MKVTVLVDNQTLIDQYYVAEPGLSMLIEDGPTRILFDVGYSDAFLRNAKTMHLECKGLDYLVFSHGHFDHTWGLPHLIRYYAQERIQGEVFSVPTVLAHPEAFTHKVSPEIGPIGSLMDAASLERFFPLELVKEPKWLTDRILYLGEIPQIYSFEQPLHMNLKPDAAGLQMVEDDLVDDTALALLTEEGLVLVTGCAHRGVCSTLAYAKKLTGEERVVDILGGFHLLSASEERLSATVVALQSMGVHQLSPCHCVDQAAKCYLGQAFGLRDVGCGLTLSYGAK